MASSNLDRRSFLRGAGASALLTAATFEPVLAERPSLLLRTAQKDFDFRKAFRDL